MPEDIRSQSPKWIQLTIQGLIVYSVITMCLETMPELVGYRRFFRGSEIVVIAIFTIEYFVFWMLSSDKLKYPFRFMSLVDLLAILPFYISLGIDLRAIRAIRLLRIFRILKLGRYSRALNTLAESVRRSAPELAMFGFISVIIIIISAMALYYAENSAQPDVYSSIPASIWWAVVTLTTVGYGDVYPVTPIGRIVAGVIMLLGISFIAFPTGILSSTMNDIIRERHELERIAGGTHEIK